MSSNYLGNNDQVHVGNGADLPISHLGYGCITSLNHIFHLNNLLHVALITKILISVSQFASDNYVFFEFHPIFLSYEGSSNWSSSAGGTLHKELYGFDISSQAN